MKEISSLISEPSTNKGERIEAEDPVSDFIPNPSIPEAQNLKKPWSASLPTVDHSKVSYNPILKVLKIQQGYKEHPSVNSLSPSEVAAFISANQISIQGDDSLKPVLDFHHLPLELSIIDKLAELNILKPTPVQSFSLPAAFAGRDLLAISQTASGKTLAFALPVGFLCKNQGKITKINGFSGPTALVLVPTRELCLQVFKEIKKFLAWFKMKIVAVYGGVPKSTQWKELKNGCDIVVATPARLIDLLQAKACSLKNVGILVVDEADLMFSMGFEYQVRSILSQIRPDRQTLLFSATFRHKLEQFVQDILSNPIKLHIGSSVHCNPNISQEILVLDHPSKKLSWLLENLQKFLQSGLVLVFVRHKNTTEELFEILKEAHIPCGHLHGDMDQQSRESIFSSFQSGQFKVLVATDVASRGLNVKTISTVVNYDCAKDVETHVHRIGRTGRTERNERNERNEKNERTEKNEKTETCENSQINGKAFTLMTKNDKKFAGDLLLNLEYNEQVVPDKLEKLAMEDSLFRMQRMKNDKRRIRHCKTADPNTASKILEQIKDQSVKLDLNHSVEEIRQEIQGKQRDYFQQEFKQKFRNAGSLEKTVENTTVSFLEKPRKKSKWDVQ
jgi:ATP-dependent RNA helicase DDX42